MSDTFQWTDELVKKFVKERTIDMSLGLSLDDRIYNFKQVNLNKDWEIVERFDYYKVPCDGDVAPIKSVRRLSDGEVFSVGEKRENICTSGEFTIDYFYVVGSDIWANDKSVYGNKQNHLSNIRKAKQPLFTTEDGKSIYEGDKFWIAIIQSGRIYDFTATEDDRGKWKGSKKFATAEAAKEYIIMNKPCLSLNDLLSVWGDGDLRPDKKSYATSPLFNLFKRLAQQKISSQKETH